jgi:hypothetical protein
MNKLIINYGFILLLLTIVSCKKEKDIDIVEKYVIEGKILNDSINWRINTTTIQPVTAGLGMMMNFTEDENMARPVFEYSHVDYKNAIGQVMIFAPAYNIKDSLDKKKALFTIGKKDFTNDSLSKIDGFKVEILYHGALYTTSLGAQENKTFEITELEFVPDDFEPEKYILARTSITLNCSLYDLKNNYVGEIKNLVFDADFKLEK